MHFNMTRSFLILAALALAGMASAKTPTTFVPRTSSVNNKALAVRGGGIDPADVAKAGTLLAGTHATLTLMSPSRTAGLYGVESTPMTDFLSQWQGIVVLGFCLQAWEMIVKGSEFKKAVAISQIPSFIMQYKTFWNEDHKKLGYKLGPQFIGAILCPLVLYVATNDGPYTDVVLKLVAVYGLISGVLSAFAPDTACDGYGVEATPENKASLKYLGYLCLGSSLFYALNLFTDVDTIKAFGYSWIPVLIMQVSNNFITKESHAKGPSYAWMLVDAIIVGVCGFMNSGGGAAPPVTPSA